MGTCQYTRQSFIRFYGLNNHERDVAVTTRDPDQLVIPTKAHSFQFFDVFTAVVESESGQVLMKSKEINFSPIGYCGGRLYNLEDGERLFHDHESVDTQLEAMDPPSTIFDAIRQGKFPGVTHVIQRRNGDIRPFRQGVDTIVPV